MAKSKGITVKLNGLNSALRRMGDAKGELLQALGDDVEKGALNVVNQAAEDAPYLGGFLKNSIIASPREINTLTWEVGSDLPYARRQEYEHASKRGFFRKALTFERIKLRKRLESTLKKVDGR
jgi:hypothetical protein